MSVIEFGALGLIQGVTEWLPISSEGMIVLAKTSLFGGGGITDLVRQALFLHLGTFLAALVYFRKDVGRLLGTAARYRSAGKEMKGFLKFLVLSTLVSLAVGYGLLELLTGTEAWLGLTGQTLTIMVGILLLGTGLVQLRARDTGLKDAVDAGWLDSLTAGIAQGIAVLPGLSRSGLTIGSLLLRRFDRDEAIRMSFIMSLPAVLLGNVYLNRSGFGYSVEALFGLLVAFLVGYLTIHVFLRVSRAMNFGKFVFGFGVLTILAALLFL